MNIVLVIIAFLLLIVGLLGAVIPIIPGPPLSFIGLLLLQWSGFGSFSIIFLILFGLITVAVTVMDYILPSLLAKKFGGSKAAAIGSFIGLVIGIFFFAPWGLILGPFLGALTGELIHNRQNGIKALKVAFGAFLAFIVGTGSKLVTSALMIFFAVTSLFN